MTPGDRHRNLGALPPPFVSRARRLAPEAGAAFAGLAWFLLLGGGRTLDPSNLDWLGYGDRASHLTAWLLFRNEPWRLPLGRIDGLLHPLGSTIAFADGIPLVALVARALSPLLPVDFQYLGPWMAACFALQGWFGARLVRCWSEGDLDRLLGGTLLALAPPLAARAVDPRMLHPSLCAQWLVIAMLGIACARDLQGRAAARALATSAALVAVAVFVHPVLAAMTLALAAAIVARLTLERALPVRALVLRTAAIPVSLAVSLALLGYFGSTPPGLEGFGFFSADLLTLVDPMWMSAFLPALPMDRGQYEGFAYLGLGALALVALGLGLAVTRRRSLGARLGVWAPLAVVTAGMALFALSSSVTLAGRPVLALDGLYAHATALTRSFRSSGRFVWPLHYLLVAAALAAVLRLAPRRPRLATAAIGAAVALQVADLWPARRQRSFAEEPWRLTSPAWNLAAGHYRHLALAPPYLPGAAGTACEGPYQWDYYVPLAHLAYRLRTTFSSGFVARLDFDAAERSCRQARAELLGGVLREDTLYVVHPAFLTLLARRGAVCGRVEGHAVCVAPRVRDPFRDLLAAQADGDRAASRGP